MFLKQRIESEGVNSAMVLKWTSSSISGVTNSMDMFGKDLAALFAGTQPTKVPMPDIRHRLCPDDRKVPQRPGCIRSQEQTHYYAGCSLPDRRTIPYGAGW